LLYLGIIFNVLVDSKYKFIYMFGFTTVYDFYIGTIFSVIVFSKYKFIYMFGFTNTCYIFDLLYLGTVLLYLGTVSCGLRAANSGCLGLEIPRRGGPPGLNTYVRSMAGPTREVRARWFPEPNCKKCAVTLDGTLEVGSPASFRCYRRRRRDSTTSTT